MNIILIMLFGVLVGAKLFPAKYVKLNEKAQLVCTVVLIFAMGVTLGRRENFFEELSTMGVTSFLYFLFPVLFSVIFVYFLTKRFMSGKKGE